MHQAPLAVIVLLVSGASVEANPALPHVSAQGSAAVRVAPDVAILRLGGQFEAEDAVRAQQRASSVIKAVIDTLLQRGVQREAMQTTRVSLTPVYASGRQKEPGKRVLTGFRALDILEVKLPIGTSSSPQVGEVIDAATQQGANRVEGIRFEIEDDTSWRLKALRRAAQKAREKSSALAQALGAELGELQLISESTTRDRPIYKAAMVEGGGTTVEPGMLTIRATVRVRYLLEFQK